MKQSSDFIFALDFDFDAARWLQSDDALLLTGLLLF